MRFQVPQFIEIEDKVFGPFTFKQFIYIAGGIGFSFILLRLLPRYVAYVAILPIATLSLSLAFYRINGKPFIQLIESAVKYLFGSRLYVWKKSDRVAKGSVMISEKYGQVEMPKMTESKLKDLFWTIDVKDHPGHDLKKER